MPSLSACQPSYYLTRLRDCAARSPVDVVVPHAVIGGQFFNVFNLGKSEAELQTLKTKELKNGENFEGFAIATC